MIQINPFSHHITLIKMQTSISAKPLMMISLVRATVWVCVAGSRGHLASRAVVSVTGRNTRQSPRRGKKKWKEAKRQRTLQNNHSLPRHPHTEFCQHKHSHPPALPVQGPANTAEPNRHSSAGFLEKAYAW